MSSRDGSDDDDDGWVHGGRYVPILPPRSSSSSDNNSMSPQRRLKSSSSHQTITPQSSRWGRLGAKTPSWTPFAVKQRRHIHNQSTMTTSVFTTPAAGGPVIRSTWGSELGTHPNLLVRVVAFIWNYFFASLWNSYIRDNTPPLLMDIIESIIEAIEVVLDYIIQVLRFIVPHVASTIQICALFSGKVFRLIKHLGAGRGLRGCLAEDAGVEVGSPFSAIKALRDKVLNSPHIKGKLPFSGFANPFSQSPNVDNVRVESVGNSSSSSSSSIPRVEMASSTLCSGTSAVTSTEKTPSGVLRSGGQTKRSTTTDSTPPSLSSSSGNRNMRRVLFTTTETGDVHTERFRYDKELPASARKAPPPSPTAKRGVTDGSSVDNRIERVEQVAPSQGGDVVVAASSASIQSPSSVPISLSNQNMQSKVSVEMRNDKVISTDEEMRKQEYIQRYGLLPSITPLSKRYGRMKRQQQSSSNATAAVATINMNKPGINNRKRRGDLLGVASRLGRDRRARLTTQSTFLFDRRRTPKRGREEETRANEWVWRAMNNIGGGEKENNANGEPGSVAKRGKFDRPVSNDAEQQVAGQNNTGGSSGNDRGFLVGTPPPKNVIANPMVDRVLTPPNTPFPSKARINAPATPAIRKTSINYDDDEESAKITFAFGSAVKNSTDATPVKPSDDTTSDGGIAKTGFSFTTATTTSATTSTAAAATNFSFDTATRAKADDGGMVGAFEKSTDAANTAKFTFSENQAGGTFTAKAVMFGSTPQPTSTSIADKSSNPSLFSFDMAKTSETTTPAASGPVATAPAASGPVATAPASLSSGAGFSFGAGPTTSLTASTSVAPTPAAYSFVSTPSVPNNSHGVSLSFGTGATSPAPAHGATVIRPSSTGFAFGSTQLAGSATTAQSSTFSFGTATATGRTPSVLVAPNFGVAPTNTFNPTQGGAASSGASARRRAAKQIGRKK